MKVYVELFLENGGNELGIRAADYETELATIELEEQMNPDEDLIEQKKQVQERKEQYALKF